LSYSYWNRKTVEPANVFHQSRIQLIALLRIRSCYRTVQREHQFRQAAADAADHPVRTIRPSLGEQRIVSDDHANERGQFFLAHERCKIIRLPAGILDAREFPRS